MIWIRLISMAFGLLYAIYYIMLVAQLLGAFKFTNRNFSFIRCLIPFYYWIAPQDEVTKEKEQKN